MVNYSRVLMLVLVIAFVGAMPVLAQKSTKFNFSKYQQSLMQPPYLKSGDTIAIVATSGVLKNREDAIEKAKALMESWGLHVVMSKHLYHDNGHFAGTDANRAADFQKALDDPKIKAIWCARGGYGAVRILDKIDYSSLKTNPKWLIGFSDVTALHNQFNILGVESIHGMMCVNLEDRGKAVEKSIESFRKVLFGEPLVYTVDGSKYNRVGVASGQLVGGNLTVMHTMLGSKTSIDTGGKILFIEEIGEYAYHIDRMFQSLKRAGYFDGCKGLIIGDISNIRPNTTEFGRTIEELILDVVADCDFPVMFNFPAGHEPDNQALILGRNIVLTVGKDRSTVVFDQ